MEEKPQKFPVCILQSNTRRKVENFGIYMPTLNVLQHETSWASQFIYYYKIFFFAFLGVKSS